MAKFLQDTLEETALLSDQKDAEGSGVNKKFADFMKKVNQRERSKASEMIS